MSCSSPSVHYPSQTLTVEITHLHFNSGLHNHTVGSPNIWPFCLNCSRPLKMCRGEVNYAFWPNSSSSQWFWSGCVPVLARQCWFGAISEYLLSGMIVQYVWIPVIPTHFNKKLFCNILSLYYLNSIISAGRGPDPHPQNHFVFSCLH